MAPVDGGYPLSFAQEQLWLLDQLRSGDAAEYLMHETFRIRGPLDTGALSAALTETAARHEVLRTRYADEDGVAVQIIDEPEPVKTEFADLGDVPDDRREQSLREFAARWAGTAIDLRRDHPWRVAVVRLAPEDWALLLTFHHIAFDGWSWGLLADELRELYGAYASNGVPAPEALEPLELQYADYADWQREWWSAQPELMDQQLRYWRERLAGAAPLELPTDRPRPARWDASGDAVAFTVPAPLAARFSALAKEQGATVFMAGLAAYQLLLARYSGAEDIAVGVSLANRDDARLERLIGLFLNTVVLRTDLGGAPDFRELLSRVKDTTLDAYSHQEVPFERVVAALAPERDAGRNPVFQAGFALHNAHRRPFALPGMEVTRAEGGTHSSAFDLSLHLAERPDGTMAGEFIYPTALFDRDRVERMAENFLHLLDQAITMPGTPVDRLELTGPSERATLTTWGQGTPRPAEEDRSGHGLVRLVLDQAAATPRATAVADDGGLLDYAGLAERVTRLAGRLHTEGVRPGDPVAVSLHRGPELVTAILAVLAVGGIHVPLAPDLPDVRRDFLLTDSGADLVLTEEALRDHFGDGLRVRALDGEWSAARVAPDVPPDVLPWPAGPDDAACLVYTSGSTGTPKGVVVTHGGLRNRVLWSVEAYAMTAADRLLQKTTIGFDASLWEFLSPLVSGGTVVMAPADAHRDPSVMAAAMARHRVTLLQLVPSVLRLLVQEPALSDCTALRLVSSAGEPLTAELCERLRAVVPGAEISNTYGPTECSIDSTAHRWKGEGLSGSGTVAIGAPLPGVGVSVVDRADLLVPVGVPGELCVRGAGLARGYLGRPGQTAERFGVDPYAAVPGGRWYRTGDLVRWRADGTLEFLGRTDDQVKIHGVRVEPAEIEALLLAHPGAAASAVVARPGAHGERELTAYAVPSAPGDAGAELRAELLAHLAARLPAAVVPSRLVLLDALPLTASGKVDRRALPGPEEAVAPPAATATDRTAPRTATERAVVEAMAATLEVPEPGLDDDFFGLGGHSLLAIRLVLGLRRAFNIEMTVAELFTDRTPAALAARIDRAVGAAEAAEAGQDGAGTGIVPVSRDGELPLSFGQQRMWFLDRLEPGSQEYLIPLALRLRGPLDTAAFRGALDEVARVHEVLRTRYADRDGRPVQLIDPPGPVAFRLVDLTGAGDGTKDVAGRARELLEEALRAPFDLSAEHPLRVSVIRAAPEDHWVALAAHHIAFDAWSTKVFLRDLDTAYTALAAGRPTPLRPGPVQYADFAAWQRGREDGPENDRHLHHWLERLGGLTPVELPSDRPRTATRDAAGDTVVVDVPEAVGRAVTELANRHGATPFMALLGAFQVLLHRYTGRTDIAVGVPVAARTREETEGLLGLFVNSLVIRTDLGGDPAFSGLLARVKEVCLEAFAHQDVPFEQLVDELGTDRDLSRNPLFQVMFEHQHMGGLTTTLGGLGAEPLKAGPQTAKFDLTLTVKERPDGRMHCWFEYASALFDRATVERMAAHYLRLLESVTTAPDTTVAALELMPEAERRQLLASWPDPYAARLPEIVPEAERGLTVPELFVRQAARTPDATALVFGAEHLDYAALEARSARFARRLRALGAGPETVVASCQERGIDAVVTLLGVLRAGAVYVPLDPRHPRRRLSRTVGDSGARFVVTTTEHAGSLTGDGHQVLTVDALDYATDTAEGLPDVPVAPDSLAYMIYTSGSTGRPKGVMIDHRAYAHHCRIAADAYGIGPGERVVQLSSLTFDVSMEQIAAPLLTGAAVVIADPLFWSPAELPARIAEHGVTVMETTPAYYREVMAYDTSMLTGLKLINLSSDVVTVADARQWSASGLPGRFVCCYGPTEATVTCLLHTGSAGHDGGRGTASMPLGRPFAGTGAYVLDARLRPVPLGVPGELCVGGVRLARGYHGRPELTAEQFVPDPFGGAGERLYRTGDLVRYRPDGTLEFLGRIDQQVKIRGLRIELGEIEAALTGHPGVGAAAVTAPEISPGGRQLAAYVTGRDDSPAPDPEVLREYLRERLPDYMVPALWTALDTLPMTSSQKIDRKSLPAPAFSTERTFVAPRDPAEEMVAAIWAEALGVERVGAEDDFFALGGHSLLATRVLARIQESFAVDLPLRRLFENTTVATLAAAVTEAVEAAIAQLSDAEVAELLSPEGAR